MLHFIDKLAGAWFDWRARRVSGNPELVSLNNVELNEDGLTVTGFSPAIAVLADGAAAMLEHHNAKNFVEFDMYPRLDRGMQPVRVVVAWANGEMPSAKCIRLEREYERLEGEKRQLLYTFWGILDGILRNGDGDTLWANDGTTAHEALVEVAAQYVPDVANDFQHRLENGLGTDEKPEEVESSWNEDGEPVADHRPEHPYYQAFTKMNEVMAMKKYKVSGLLDSRGNVIPGSVIVSATCRATAKLEAAMSNGCYWTDDTDVEEVENDGDLPCGENTQIKEVGSEQA